MHGRNGTVTLDGTSAVGKVTAWSYEESTDESDATAMGDTEKSVELGLPGGGGTIDCNFNETDVGQLALIAAMKDGSTCTLTIVPDDTNSTKDLEGTAVKVKGFSINSTKDDVISCSFSYNGVLTMAAIA